MPSFTAQVPNLQAVGPVVQLRLSVGTAVEAALKASGTPNTPSSTNTACYEFLVRLVFPNNVVAETTVLEAPLIGQHIDGAISMLDWLNSLFKGPEPAGPPRRIRSFSPADRPITQDGVTLDQNGWRIESREKRTARLFEIPDPGVEQCVLTYRVQMRTADVQGAAYLEISKGLHHKVKGTTGWASYETPFYLKKEQRPDLIKLNLVFEGAGTAWIRDVEVLHTPLK